jgi:outer membrane protein TolC
MFHPLSNRFFMKKQISYFSYFSYFFIAFLSLNFTLNSSQVTAQQLPATLGEFLKEVELNNDGLKSNRELKKALYLKRGERDLMYAPFVFSDITGVIDQKEPVSAVMGGTRTDNQTFNFGFRKNFKGGLGAQVSYQIQRTIIEGISPQFLPNPDFLTTAPQLQLTLPLWKNWGGKELNWQNQMVALNHEAQILGTGFQGKMLLLEATALYWQHAIMQQMISVQREILERTQKIQAWTGRRSRLELGDETDNLQAQAQVAGKRLEISSLESELRDLLMKLNVLRGGKVQDSSQDISLKDQLRWEKALEASLREVLNSPLPPFAPRENTLSQAKLNEIFNIQSAQNRQTYIPTLDLFTNIALNGNEAKLVDSMKESFSTKNPTWAIGVKFSYALDGGVVSDTALGLEKERYAQKLQLVMQEKNERRDFDSMVEQFEESKRRLGAAKNLEELQRKKILRERTRHQSGRSTTYQVLVFEQDLGQATLLKLKTMGEILMLWAKLKTFEPAISFVESEEKSL